jgi:hypothetical protein
MSEPIDLEEIELDAAKASAARYPDDFSSYGRWVVDEAVPALIAEVRRLRTDRASNVLTLVELKSAFDESYNDSAWWFCDKLDKAIDRLREQAPETFDLALELRTAQEEQERLRRELSKHDVRRGEITRLRSEADALVTRAYEIGYAEGGQNAAPDRSREDA